MAAALDHVHRAQAMGSMARAANYEPLPLEELQKLLVDDETGLLVYMPGPESGHLFALDGANLIHEKLDPSAAGRLKRTDGIRAKLNLAFEQQFAPGSRLTIDPTWDLDTFKFGGGNVQIAIDF